MINLQKSQSQTQEKFIQFKGIKSRNENNIYMYSNSQTHEKFIPFKEKKT